MPASNNPWNLGDLVELKSGGPVMTVDAIQLYESGAKARIHCTWFTSSHEWQKAEFCPEALKKAE